MTFRHDFQIGDQGSRGERVKGIVQEGELRPQLLDRFGLSVSVATMQDTAVRTRMVLDRLAFDTVCWPVHTSLPKAQASWAPAAPV